MKHKVKFKWERSANNPIFVNSNAGAQSAMYPYVGELLPNRSRSKLMVIIGYATSMAMFVMSGVGWLMERHGSRIYITESYSIAPWRQQIILLAIPGIICVVIFCFLPESPKFLTSKGRKSEALEGLRFIHQRNCRGKIEFPIEGLVDECEHQGHEKKSL